MYASADMASTPSGGVRANSAGRLLAEFDLRDLGRMDGAAWDRVAGVVQVRLSDSQDQPRRIVDPEVAAGTGEMVGRAPGHGFGADVSPARRRRRAAGLARIQARRAARPSTEPQAGEGAG